MLKLSLGTRAARCSGSGAKKPMGASLTAVNTKLDGGFILPLLLSWFWSLSWLADNHHAYYCWYCWSLLVSIVGEYCWLVLVSIGEKNKKLHCIVGQYWLALVKKGLVLLASGAIRPAGVIAPMGWEHQWPGESLGMIRWAWKPAMLYTASAS